MVRPRSKQPQYTLLASDITAAYSKKVQSVVRSSVLLNLGNPKTPAALIVYDRVVAADAAFKKLWLLHTIEEPRLDGNQAIVDRTEHGQRGRLVLTPLLPAAENLQIETVGGRGREYSVFGENYANDQDLGRSERSSQEPGAWRIEISPKQPAAEDHFLNVMQVTDRIDGFALPTERIESKALVGCRLASPDADWIVVFPSEELPLQKALTLAVSGKRGCRILVCGLHEGTWTVTAPEAEPREVKVEAESGTAWLEGPAGNWTFAPK